MLRANKKDGRTTSCSFFTNVSSSEQAASTYKASEGQAALPFVLLVAGIVVEIIVVGTVLGMILSSVSLGEELSARALAAANSGVYDAMMKASNNKEFASGGVTYDLNVGSDTTSVEVSRSVDSGNDVYVYTATSTATARNRQRRMTANFLVDRTTGEVSMRSVGEKPVQ